MANLKLAGPDAKGNFRRDLGWEYKNGNYVQHRFYVGRDREDGCNRVERLESLWDAIEKSWRESRQKGQTVAPHPTWDVFTLSIGMAIARGDATVVLDPSVSAETARIGSAPILLATWFGVMCSRYGNCGVRLTLPESVEVVRIEGEAHEKRLNKILGGGGEGLHAALDAFGEWIATRYCTTDGTITPSGKRYQRQILQIEAHCADVPLSSFGHEAIESLLYQWQRRPISTKTKKPMAIETCRDVIKRIRQFLRWLHISPYEWRMPADYVPNRICIKASPAELSARTQPHGRRTYTVEELTTLWEYGSPWERLMMILALNCGFGGAEIATLQVDEITVDCEHGHYKLSGSWVKRIRFKTGVYGEWRLWPETVQAIEWAKRRRGETAETALVLSNKGKPLSTTTGGGSRNMRIANTWRTLLQRVCKDYPQFRKLSFGKLRKTASSFVRRKYGAEIAGVFLAHGQVCTDDLLERYADRNFVPVFRACRHWRKRLEPMFAAVDDPFPMDMRKRNPSVTPAQTKRMVALRAEGKTIAAIATIMDVSRDTVRTHLRGVEVK